MGKFSVALLIGLAGCVGGPVPPFANLPPGMVTGGTDPFRYAVLTSAYAFNNLGPEAAPAKAQGALLVEYLAASQPWDRRWSEFAPPVGAAFDAARAELRQVLAIAPDASPQQVVSGLALARRRLEGEAGLPPLPAAAFPAPETTLQRLAALPPLPSTRGATAMAERELLRLDQERLNQQSGSTAAGGRP
jgi:hypothetical protein